MLNDFTVEQEEEMVRWLQAKEQDFKINRTN